MTSTMSIGRSGVVVSWVPNPKPKPRPKRGFLLRKLLKGWAERVKL